MVVDLVVTDGKGAPVRGLTRADFIVKEDGVAQEIATFEAIDRPAMPATTAVAAAGAGAPALATNSDAALERTTIVVVFDEQHLSSISTEEVRRRLEAVWSGLGAANVLLVSTAGGGNWLGRLPEDAEGLQAALARFKGGRQPENAGKLTDYEAFLIAARRDDRVLVEVYRRHIDQGIIPDPTRVGGERQIHGSAERVPEGDAVGGPKPHA